MKHPVPTPEILPPSEVGKPGDVAIAAASIVHDLGNLIQIAASALNLLLRSPTMPPTHSGPLLRRASSSLEHAGAIVQRSLRSVRHAPERRSGVHATVADVAMLVGSMEAAGFAVAIEVEPGLPDAACDPLDLRRALLNLVLNAREAMAGRGRVRIEARSVASSIELLVADDGVGMSAATLECVFDPLFSTKSAGSGGIGLPMVERFVHDAGGSISIASSPSAGTTVAIRLPVAAAAEMVL